MKHLFILTYVLSCFSFCQAQKLNSIYYGVSSDSLHITHQLEFKNNSTLEISTLPRHMSRQFKMTFNYKRVGETIKIISDNIITQDSIALIKNGLSQFLNKPVFIINGKALTDRSSKTVYVLYTDFQRNYYLTYLIDGKSYKQETGGLSDAYGLIKYYPKDNKALQRKLTSIKDDLDNYTIHVYKGLDAYDKFGYDSVFGVIELKHKK